MQFAPLKRQRINPTRLFTAMELAVIFVIMLTVMSVLIPVIGSVKKRQDQANCQNNLMSMGIAASDWQETHDGYLPSAKTESQGWHQELQSLPTASSLALNCTANNGSISENSAINYGWNSYLGDVDLTDKPILVRSAWLERPTEILLAGDGTASGDQTTLGTPIVWSQKTWRRESKQAYAPEPIHGENLNYLFADLHVTPIALDDPYLVENPAGYPTNNYWVEVVNPAPGPFFNTPNDAK